MADLRFAQPTRWSANRRASAERLAILTAHLLLLASIQISCRYPWAASDSNGSYSRIVSIRRSDPDAALIEAQHAFHEFGQSQSEEAWRFRLLYANLLLDATQNAAAAELVREDPPPGPQHAFLASQLAVTRVRIASKKADWPLVEKLNAEALRLLPAARDPCAKFELRAIGIQNLINAGRLDEAGNQLTNWKRSGQSCLDPYWEAIRLFLNGRLLFERFQNEEARDAFAKALKFSRSHQLKQLAASLLANLATCHLYLGDTTLALQSLDEASKFRTKGQVLERSTDRGRRGLIYVMLNQSEKAEVEYEAALKGATQMGFRPFEARWLNELTSLACNTGHLPAAANFSRESLKTVDRVKDKDEYFTAELNAARIARLQQDFVTAKQTLSSLSSMQESDSFLWEYQAEHAQLLTAMNEPAAAKREFLRAIATAESARAKVRDLWYRITFSARLLDLYRRYVDFLINRGDKNDALKVVESFHARQLLEKLGSTQKIESVANLSHLADVQHAIILSYWVGIERSYMWVTTTKGSQMFPLGDTKRLESQIRYYRGDLENISDVLHNSASSMALYRELIAKASSLIPEGSKVIVVPDGPLADLNFETLISPNKPGHYWFETVSIAVAPSLMLLHAQEAENVAIPTLLLVGGTKPPAEFPALPGSQQEIQEIDLLFRAKNPLVLAGDNATPEKFLAADPGHFSLIHLSAHAVAVKENPLDSAIILTPDKGNGNFKIYARQLSAMRLRAELVTLSACRGAGAKAVPGEGLVGLTWAFLSAGAHNVVAGLWDVPDKASADLMERFYSHLQKGEPPGAALRSAKLEMCSRNAPPYDWAAFQLYTH